MLSVQTPAAGETSASSLLLPNVLCCLCGVAIVPNSVNTCAACLASTTDITRGISTSATLHQCRGCNRWHQTSGKWIACELESRELMSLCLSNVSGLRSTTHNKEKGSRLVDAAWIWTEPHSMRLKVRLTVQREVQSGTILQQSFTVEFIVRNQQCIDCQAVFRQGSWKSLVQVRQRVHHKRTFLYLEQLILKHGAHRGCLKIETFKDGMDFYFPDKGKAARFISFLENVVPVRLRTSKKLISQDHKSNVANFKYTNLVEICPLCKDDLVYLPAKLARSLGNLSRLVLVKNVSNLIHFLDPLSGQAASMDADVYWRNDNSLRPLIVNAKSRLTRYVVLSKDAVVLRTNASQRRTSHKVQCRLARVMLAREEDLGRNDQTLEELSHVGYLLKSGDVCVGYDLKEMQLVDDEAENVRASGKFPDVVIVRKLYGGAAIAAADSASMQDGSMSGTARQRIWKMKRLDVESTDVDGVNRREGGRINNKNDAMDIDEEQFMQEVEADREMRSSINLYRREDVLVKLPPVTSDDGEDEEDDDDQEVRLDELLESLALDAGPDEENPDFDPVTIQKMMEDEVRAYSSVEEGQRALKDGIPYVAREAARIVREKDVAVHVQALSDNYLDKSKNNS